MIFYRISISAYQHRRVCSREDIKDETKEKQHARLEMKEGVIFVDFIDLDSRSSGVRDT